MLCVLLVHALFAWAFMLSARPDPFIAPLAASSLTPMEFFEIREEEDDEEATPVAQLPARVPEPPRAPSAEDPAEQPATQPATPPPPGYIDWPRETRLSAARVLEREREAERLARMFAGPDGTWASLTKRQRSKLNKFKWAPGVDGLERDENGNTIYRLPSGCTIVNFMFFGCPIGKQPVNDDMFENMRLYFDEQRLPQTNEGNGTEPESKRPPKWSKPLPD
jgi:hypothetical protein